MRTAALALFLFPALAGCGGPYASSISVSSTPPGARILIDGCPIGQTPETCLLEHKQNTRLIRVELDGFEPQEAKVTLTSRTDVMSPKEAAKNICLSPCCLGLPLLNLLQPVETQSFFLPTHLDFTLKPIGEGLLLTVAQPATVLIDGAVIAQLAAHTPRHLRLPPGLHQAEIRSDGHRPWANPVEVRAGEFLKMDIALQPEAPKASPWLGALLTAREAGVFVSEIRPDSPAAAADLRPGDRLVAVDGSPASTLEAIERALERKSPGDHLVLEVERAATPLKLTVTLTRRIP